MTHRLCFELRFKCLVQWRRCSASNLEGRRFYPHLHANFSILHNTHYIVYICYVSTLCFKLTRTIVGSETCAMTTNFSVFSAVQAIRATTNWKYRWSGLNLLFLRWLFAVVSPKWRRPTVCLSIGGFIWKLKQICLIKSDHLHIVYQ